MFNEIYKKPLELFSWQHLVALATVVVLIFAVFFARKFFMKNKIADRVFRYTLAFIMAFFELFLHLYNGFTPIVDNFIHPVPLCGFMLWFSVIALCSDNAKLEKLIFPLAILGATMSLIVVDSPYTFPHFEAFKFFATHACFLIGALYFVFTKKISTYKLKDFGKSCLLLFVISSINFVICFGYDIINEPYFVLTPPGDLMFIKDALGQFGYSICYILLVVGVLFGIFGLTYLGTKNRKEDDILIPKTAQTNKCKKIYNFVETHKLLLTLIIISSSIYITTMANVLNNVFFTILDWLAFLTLLFYFVLLGVVYNYKIFNQTQYNENNNTKECVKEENKTEEINIKSDTTIEKNN